MATTDDPDPRKAIVGAWRLVHSVEFGPGGERRYPFGEDAAGYIMYSETGVMTVQKETIPVPFDRPRPL